MEGKTWRWISLSDQPVLSLSAHLGIQKWFPSMFQAIICFISLSLPPSTLDSFLQTPSQQKWDLHHTQTSNLHTTNTQTTVIRAVNMQIAVPRAPAWERSEKQSSLLFLRELFIPTLPFSPTFYSKHPAARAHPRLVWTLSAQEGGGICQPLRAALYALFSGLFAVRAAGFRPLKGWIPSFDLRWLMGYGKALQLKYTVEFKKKKGKKRKHTR